MNFLKSNGIEISGSFVNRFKSIDKPSRETVLQTGKELNVEFPSEYVDLCVEVGGGHLMLLDLFVPGDCVSHHSLEWQTLSVKSIMSGKKLKYTFAWSELVVFGCDSTQSVYFGWKSGYIYGFSVRGEHPAPPSRIGDDFQEFLEEYVINSEIRGFISELSLESDSEEDDDVEKKFTPFIQRVVE